MKDLIRAIALLVDGVVVLGWIFWSASLFRKEPETQDQKRFVLNRKRGRRHGEFAGARNKIYKRDIGIQKNMKGDKSQLPE